MRDPIAQAKALQNLTISGEQPCVLMPARAASVGNHPATVRQTVKTGMPHLQSELACNSLSLTVEHNDPRLRIPRKDRLTSFSRRELPGDGPFTSRPESGSNIKVRLEPRQARVATYRVGHVRPAFRDPR
jgi:hypothetical protein